MTVSIQNSYRQIEGKMFTSEVSEFLSAHKKIHNRSSECSGKITFFLNTLQQILFKGSLKHILLFLFNINDQIREKICFKYFVTTISKTCMWLHLYSCLKLVFTKKNILVSFTYYFFILSRFLKVF